MRRRADSELAAEIGDVLFAVANLTRHLKIDPEAAVRLTNEKFQRRFGFIESTLAAQGRNINEVSLSDMEDLWGKAKEAERA